MPIKQIYLTIDDVPSIHLQKKVDFLLAHNIPVIFFARGEFIKKRSKQLVYVIKKGFLVGDHTYTHPKFSQLTLSEYCDEILKTEKLIEECYKKANVARPAKVIRLPFGDRGAGRDAVAAKTEAERKKVVKLQKFLHDEGFVPLSYTEKCDDFIDLYWDWDTGDYKIKMVGNPDVYKKKLQNFYDSYTKDSAILMLHDFNNNQHLFEITMQFLLDKKVKFLPLRPEDE